MGITHLSGLEVAGVWTMGVGGLPFFTGNYFFVDAVSGSDGNTGTSPQQAFQSIPTAYAACTDGNNDVVVLIGRPLTAASTTGSFRLTSTLTWAKSATHMIGVTAPVFEGARCRITTLTTATTNINPLMTVSATGCHFANFSFFQGVGQSATDEKLIDITGDRNYFYRIQFGGMGATAGAARAGSYIMKLNDGDENLFEHCSIGLETVQRSAANASVLVVSGSQRNEFRDCIFPMAASATSPLWVDASASNALNGSSMTFTRCLFRALLNITSAATPAVVASVANDVNGTIFFDDCTAMATDWSSNTTGVVKTSCYVPNGNTGGLFVNPA